MGLSVDRTCLTCALRRDRMNFLSGRVGSEVDIARSLHVKHVDECLFDIGSARQKAMIL